MKYVTSFLLYLACVGSCVSCFASEVNDNSYQAGTQQFAKQPSIENMIGKYQDQTTCYSSQSYGTSAFTVNDPSLWYTITTDAYPTTTPLSFNGNLDQTTGYVFASPTGITIGESGNYWVQMTAIMQNPGTDTVLIPVFLVRNETYDPDGTDILGSIIALQPETPAAINEAGPLMDVTAGTRLSIVATNAGYPDPTDVQVVSWKISLFKLP